MEVDINEQKIIDGCISGNSAMQKELFEKHSKALMGVCSRYFKNSDDAEDVLQDSFIKIFSKIKTFRKDVPVFFWMRRIAINTAINKLRENKNLLSESAMAYSEHFQDNNNVLDNINTKDLLAIVQELPDGFRAVFNLRAIDGYTHAEIAVMLGISEGTSKSQYSRAKSHLRKTLSEKVELEPEMV